MASPPKSKILHNFGLAGHPTDSSVSNEEVQALVKKGADRARAAGHEVQLTFVEPGDFPGCLYNLKEQLETGTWDALIIGGGLLYVTPALTPHFEQTINIAKDVAPRTKLLFQMTPGDIHETIQTGIEGKV